MCGFFVAAGPLKTLPTQAQCSSALASLADRGPDGEGLHRGECHGTEFVFGHRRLAVVGLDNGAQPLVSGSRVLVVNGEFYNHDLIRCELEDEGIRFRTRSDSEIVLRLFERFGGGCADDGGPGAWAARLTGEWTFVLWDGAAGTLWACCDPFGTRPLRYWISRDGRQIKFASEAKALLELGVEQKLDETALRFALEFHHMPWQQTLFDGIRMVPPGTWLRWQPGSLRTGQLWDHARVAPTRAISASAGIGGLFDLGGHEAGLADAALRDGASRADKVRALRALIEGSVERRLPAETKFCSHISGGVDSAGVAALVKRASGADLTAFTASFPWASSGDETPLARVTADLVGLRLNPVEMEPGALLRAMDETAYRAEGISYNLHAGAKILLADATREAGFKVTFTGEGADEAFFGYEFFRGEFDAHERPVTADVNAAMLGVQRPDGHRHGDLEPLRQALGSVPAWITAKAVSGHALAQGFGPRLQETPVDRARFATALPPETLSGIAGSSAPERARALWSIYGLSTYILRGLEDPNGMSRGVEGRYIFLDPAIQWFAARLPPLSHYGEDGMEKGLLREALRDVLPEPILKRPKRSFFVPSVFEIDEGRQWARERLLGGRLVSSKLFSEQGLLHILAQPATPGRDIRICSLATLAAFMDVFNLQ